MRFILYILVSLVFVSLSHSYVLAQNSSYQDYWIGDAASRYWQWSSPDITLNNIRQREGYAANIRMNLEEDPIKLQTYLFAGHLLIYYAGSDGKLPSNFDDRSFIDIVNSQERLLRNANEIRNGQWQRHWSVPEFTDLLIDSMGDLIGDFGGKRGQTVEAIGTVAAKMFAKNYFEMEDSKIAGKKQIQFQLDALSNNDFDLQVMAKRVFDISQSSEVSKNAFNALFFDSTNVKIGDSFSRMMSRNSNFESLVKQNSMYGLLYEIDDDIQKSYSLLTDVSEHLEAQQLKSANELQQLSDEKAFYKELSNYKGAVSIGSDLAYWISDDPNTATAISVGGNAITSVIEANRMFQDDFIGEVALASNYFSAMMAVSSLASLSGPSAEEQILKQIQMLANEVRALRKEVRDGFFNLDYKISEGFENAFIYLDDISNKQKYTISTLRDINSTLQSGVELILSEIERDVKFKHSLEKQNCLNEYGTNPYYSMTIDLKNTCLEYFFVKLRTNSNFSQQFAQFYQLHKASFDDFGFPFENYVPAFHKKISELSSPNDWVHSYSPQRLKSIEDDTVTILNILDTESTDSRRGQKKPSKMSALFQPNQQETENGFKVSVQLLSQLSEQIQFTIDSRRALSRHENGKLRVNLLTHLIDVYNFNVDSLIEKADQKSGNFMDSSPLEIGYRPGRGPGQPYLDEDIFPPKTLIPLCEGGEYTSRNVFGMRNNKQEAVATEVKSSMGSFEQQSLYYNRSLNLLVPSELLWAHHFKQIKLEFCFMDFSIEEFKPQPVRKRTGWNSLTYKVELKIRYTEDNKKWIPIGQYSVSDTLINTGKTHWQAVPDNFGSQLWYGGKISPRSSSCSDRVWTTEWCWFGYPNLGQEFSKKSVENSSKELIQNRTEASSKAIAKLNVFHLSRDTSGKLFEEIKYGHAKDEWRQAQENFNTILFILVNGYSSHIDSHVSQAFDPNEGLLQPDAVIRKISHAGEDKITLKTELKKRSDYAKNAVISISNLDPDDFRGSTLHLSTLKALVDAKSQTLYATKGTIY